MTVRIRKRHGHFSAGNKECLCYVWLTIRPSDNVLYLARVNVTRVSCLLSCCLHVCITSRGARQKKKGMDKTWGLMYFYADSFYYMCLDFEEEVVACARGQEVLSLD